MTQLCAGNNDAVIEPRGDSGDAAATRARRGDAASHNQPAAAPALTSSATYSTRPNTHTPHTPHTPTPLHLYVSLHYTHYLSTDNILTD